MSGVAVSCKPWSTPRLCNVSAAVRPLKTLGEATAMVFTKHPGCFSFVRSPCQPLLAWAAETPLLEPDPHSSLQVEA